MSRKYYFIKGREDEPCLPLKDHIDYMKMEDLDSITLVEAERSTGEGFFFCTINQEVGDSGLNYCGKTCKDYNPRNKVSGRCKFSGYCYNTTDKERVITNKRKD